MARPYTERIAERISRLKIDHERIQQQLLQAEGSIGDQITALEALKAKVDKGTLSVEDVDFLINEGLHLDTLSEKRPSEKPEKSQVVVDAFGRAISLRIP